MWNIRRNATDFLSVSFLPQGAAFLESGTNCPCRKSLSSPKRFAHQHHYTKVIHPDACSMPKNPCTLVLRVVCFSQLLRTITTWTTGPVLLAFYAHKSDWAAYKHPGNFPKILSMSITCNKFQTKSSIACLQPIVYWVCWDYWASRLGCLQGKNISNQKTSMFKGK